MEHAWRSRSVWWLAWALLTAAGGVWLARAELARLHEDFDTDGRIVHRLLSQQVVQYDAVLATLALLAPPADGPRPEQRLPAINPAILSVLRRDGAQRWPDGPHAEALAQAEERSRTLRRAEVAAPDLPAGRYLLVLAAQPSSFALAIDLAGTIPWRDWPMDPRHSPVRVRVEQGDRAYTVQPGRAQDGPWTFAFRKTLAAQSQPFDVVAERSVGWAELPWARIAGWSIAVGLALAALQAWLRQRAARRRAEELLRLGQAARLNTLGELGAGLAHELNQPLTAVLANAQAARRLLDDEPPELDAARDAMTQAAAQARRAAEVVGRLRRLVDQPRGQADLQPVALQEVVRGALYLLEPERQRRGVTVQEADPPTPVKVQADSVALEQIVHNLLINALQALEAVPADRRRLAIETGSDGANGWLAVNDSGPGIAAEALPRVFEPFFSTREGGLGLGLSLCESLAGQMGGTLAADRSRLGGARFELRLPLAARSAA
ncbi:MAG: two-component sensor histidine kinase [Variovorax paradoxus]|uniref:histidine kinase n=1 Tax=Variovorax paradoxus TaxID=34073 RepID=A0A2W5QLL5_VARPD|nr:MAG: two-component sensor histidine kinase [Variovorax paradoxus]